MSVEDIDAFTLLEQQASLTPLNNGLRGARNQLAHDADKVLKQATEMHLTALRDSLTDVSKAFQSVADAIEKHLAVFASESAVLREKLKAVSVKQADLDEIRRKQKDAAEGVKDRRAGAGMYQPRMAWGKMTDI